MSFLSNSTQAQSADVVFESHKGKMQRVVMYPIEFGISTANTIMNLTQQVEKYGGIDIKSQHARQQHFYTGEVIRADSSYNCGNSSNDFVPHGFGTLVYFLYAKCSSVSSVGKSTASIGLPHEIVVSEYGEVKELQDAILLFFSMYKGSFSYGRRQGKGRLTVYCRYSVDCLWDNDAPLLDCKQCVLRCLGESYTLIDTEMKPVKRTQRDLHFGNNIALSVTSEYIGMTSLTSFGETPGLESFVGLVWTVEACFIPDGVGEMLYSQGIRYCGCWKSGQRHGFGVEYNPCISTLYMGGFLYDQQEGSGMLHYCNTDTLVCGNWKKGKLIDTTDVFLPTSPMLLQGGLWRSHENWSFDHAVFVRSPVLLSGVWEPLFVDFDEMLASVPWPSQELSSTDTIEGTNYDGKEHDTGNFIPLLFTMMQRPEFMALLVPFQRCFYFLYKSCAGGDSQRRQKRTKKPKKEPCGVKDVEEDAPRSHLPVSGLSSPLSSSDVSHFYSQRKSAGDGEKLSRSIPYSNYSSQRVSRYCLLKKELEVKSLKNLSPFLLQLREFGRDDGCGTVGPPKGCCWSCPSWCDEMGINDGDDDDDDGKNGGIYCFHTAAIAEGLATRMSPAKLFERAMHDLASFVSSVRLRVLSYVAAHPAACNVSVSKVVFAVCWDSVYALVAPVLHDLAAAAEADAVIATSLALQRCAFLTRKDFLPTEVMADLGEHDEEKEIKKRIAQLFMSPFFHGRRVVEQTINGQLLLFGPYVGSEVVTPVVYASPASMFAVFESAHSYALSLFPQNALLQERFMSYIVVSAFGHATGVDPRDTLSPLAILRLLQFLACEVNPRYPFPSGRRKSRQDTEGNNIQETNQDVSSPSSNLDSVIDMNTKTEDVEWRFNLRSTSYSASTTAVELFSLFFAARNCIERLHSIYPTIRLNPFPSSIDNACGGGNDMARIVYPLDELAIRTRFVLLVAAKLVQQYDKERDDGNDSDWGSDSGVVMSIMDKSENNTKWKFYRHTRQILRLPIPAMQEALNYQMVQYYDEVIHVREDRVGGSTKQRERHEITPSLPPSPLLLWIMECIEEMLESPNYPTSGMNSTTTKKPQEFQQHDVWPLMSEEASHVDSVDSAKVVSKGFLRHCSAVGQEINNGSYGVQCLCYQWKRFFPNNGTTVDNCEDSPMLGNPTMPELLTEYERIQISLLQHFLADVGILMKFNVRFCYDNEEDLLPLCALQHNVSSMSLEMCNVVNSNSTVTEEERDITTTVAACCVGKEASLSLHVSLSFLGSLTWEKLADAWFASSLTFRSSALFPQHMRRKGTCTDVIDCSN